MPAIIRDGEAVEIYPGIAFVDAHEIQRPANWLDLASDDERVEAGVLAIVEPPAAPDGKVVRITGLKVVKGVPTRAFVVEDAPAPADPVPDAVTNFQARAALIAADLFDRADAAVRASGDKIAIQAWDYANQFYRQSPIIAALASGLQLKDGEVDDLFRAAGRVP